MMLSKKRIASLFFTLALIAVFAFVPMGVFAPIDDHDRISVATAEPVCIDWDSATSATGSIVKTDPNSSYYPSSFMFYVDNGTLSVSNGGSYTRLTDYDSDFGDAYRINLPNTTCTITVTLTNANNNSGVYYLSCAAPAGSLAAPGTTPNDACGYLPVGQFASGSGWGSLFSNGTNSTGTTEKFLNGYTSTGVSLGMLGGYIQFDYGNNPIPNSELNPYGIDFIVYGNPFNGNPEAGSVKVSSDGITWYNLAGSLHYDADTEWNQNASYIKIVNAGTTIGGQTFSSAGVYASVDYIPINSTDATEVDEAIGDATWTRMGPVAWWPEYSSENYGNIWNDGHINDVIWNRNGSAEVISYKNLTRVKDDAEKGLSGVNATNYYRFGYTDVRANGSSYGTTINPYDTLPAAASGGDGFDLSWAVDSSGKPVVLSSVRFVRVYSAVLYNAGVFGETSTEVCGIYTTSNQAASSVGTATAPTVKYGTSATAMTNAVSVSNMNMTSLNVNPGTYYINASKTGTNLFYINNEKVTSGEAYSFTVTSGKDTYVRVIAQDGTKAPFISVIKFRGN
ncbi:MAG: hypothetical protein ACOX8R_05240 [Bacillota bacterium]|jgi:hypothetical protein